jgi:hypothetical protein
VRRSVLLKWQTAAAVDNVGFNVYRARTADGPRTLVNEDLIPSLVNPGGPEGAVYRYQDIPMEGSGTYFYSVETVDIQGRTRSYGPVEVRLAK